MLFVFQYSILCIFVFLLSYLDGLRRLLSTMVTDILKRRPKSLLNQVTLADTDFWRVRINEYLSNKGVLTRKIISILLKLNYYTFLDLKVRSPYFLGYIT